MLQHIAFLNCDIHLLFMDEGRSINKLKNSVILLVKF